MTKLTILILALAMSLTGCAKQGSRLEKVRRDAQGWDYILRSDIGTFYVSDPKGLRHQCRHGGFNAEWSRVNQYALTLESCDPLYPQGLGRVTFPIPKELQ